MKSVFVVWTSVHRRGTPESACEGLCKWRITIMHIQVRGLALISMKRPLYVWLARVYSKRVDI